jgi:hypothetical protein
MRWKRVVPNGTKVKFKGLESGEYIIGIIDSNDEETAEYYRDLNYYIYPTENKEEFLNYYGSPYIMLLRKDFKIVKEEQ